MIMIAALINSLFLSVFRAREVLVFCSELFILSSRSFVVERSFIFPKVQTTNTMAATVLATINPDKMNIITSNMVDISENITQMDLFQNHCMQFLSLNYNNQFMYMVSLLQADLVHRERI